MAVRVLLPKVGLTMDEGTIEEWLVEAGAPVRLGQPLLRMATDKVDVEVEAEAEGILRPVASAGETLPPGALIAWLLADGESVPDEPASAAEIVVAVSAPDPAHVSAPAAPSVPLGVGTFTPVKDAFGRWRASPNARRVAAERGVDLTTVKGTGPDGRIVSEDIESQFAISALDPRGGRGHVAAPKPSPLIRRLARDLSVDLATVSGSGPGGSLTRNDVTEAHVPARGPLSLQADTNKVVPLTGMRGAIARNMTASLQEMAQLTHGYEANVTSLVALRKSMKEQLEGVDYRIPTVTDFVARAVVMALAEHPGLNASVREDGIHLLEQVHLGVAVALPNGLVVPVVRDADDLSIDQLAVEIRRLAETAREGRLSADDMVGGTFAITSLGTYGVDFFTPVINPGNVAILGIGRIRDGIEWEAEAPRRTDVMSLSLTFDHRAVDGAPAAEFLRTVCHWLARPLALIAG